MQSIVIVGAGHAGFQCAVALRQQGFTGHVSLISEESCLPYQRPPLSKGYVLGKVTAEALAFRPASFYKEHRFNLIYGVSESIDRAAQCVRLSSGQSVAYDHLILATGSRPRALQTPGSDLVGVLNLQTVRDADRLLEAVSGCEQIAVVGAGFIGLEFAASARLLGKTVRVLDVADGPMSRVLSPESAAAFARAHLSSGVELLFQTAVERLVGVDGRVSSLLTTRGSHISADLVLVGIGAVPRVELAEQAGLAVDNGIVVDASLLTADPLVSAVGDVASFPVNGGERRVRIESVQNATDQARTVAARLTGKTTSRYDMVPWFWSDQGSWKLQIAGLRDPEDESVLIGDAVAGNFSVLSISHGMLRAVESVNRPGDHMLARKLLAKRVRLSPDRAREPGFALKTLAEEAIEMQ